MRDMLQIIRSAFGIGSNYRQCPQGYEESMSYQRPSTTTSRLGLLICVGLVSVIIGSLLGSAYSSNRELVYSNRNSTPENGEVFNANSTVATVPVHIIQKSFHYNSTFGESNQSDGDSDPAWDSLLPGMYDWEWSNHWSCY